MVTDYEHSQWRDLAKCRGVDPDIFYPVSEQEAAAALAICAECSVRAVCLEHALALEERDGVWGGTTPRQRREFRRAQTA